MTLQFYSSSPGQFLLFLKQSATCSSLFLAFGKLTCLFYLLQTHWLMASLSILKVIPILQALFMAFLFSRVLNFLDCLKMTRIRYLTSTRTTNNLVPSDLQMFVEFSGFCLTSSLEYIHLKCFQLWELIGFTVRKGICVVIQGFLFVITLNVCDTLGILKRTLFSKKTCWQCINM